MSKHISKRKTLIDTLRAGGATVESLCEAAEVTPKALNSQFATLRLMGICPVKQEDDTFKVVSREEWEEILENRKADAAAKRQTKTPAEVHDLAVTRLARARKSKLYTEKLLKTGETELHELKNSRASIDVRIATILYDESLEAVEAEYEMVQDEETGLMVIAVAETEEDLA